MTDVRLTGNLTDALAAIARWYPATADPPRIQVSQTQFAYGSKPPLAADVLSLRAETIDALTKWATLVQQERDLHTFIAASDVPALTSFLAAHASWLAGCGDEGRYAAHELGHIAYRLEQIVRQTMPARVKRIAPCPEPGCTGILEAVVRKDEDLLPSNVYCSVDRDHRWDPHEWQALGRRTRPPLHLEGVRRLARALNESA
jgi:hypothetical protein